MTSRVVALLALLSAGCSGAFADGDGRAFGDDLGRFHVAAHLDAATCSGDSAAPSTWEFDVIMSQKNPTIYWNTGADAVEGRLGDDGRAFSFNSTTMIDVSGDDACSVSRIDDAKGTFNAAHTPKSFTDAQLRLQRHVPRQLRTHRRGGGSRDTTLLGRLRARRQLEIGSLIPLLFQ